MRFSGIGSRLGVAALLFLAPMAFLLWALLQAHAKDIDFARAELRGVAVLRTLTPIQAALAGAALGLAPPSDLAGLSAQVRSTSALLPALHDPAAAAADAVAAANPAKLGAAREALKTLIGAAGDSSNLILDPVLDSYYTTDVVLGRLPDALDRIADLATAARDTEAARTAFYVNLGGLKASADGLDASVASAIAGNPDGGTKRALAEPAAAFSKDLHGYVADVEASVLDPARTKATLANLVRFSATAQAELARLLRARIDALHRTQAIEVGGSLGLFVPCGLVVLSVVVRGVIRPLGGLTGAMGRLAHGDLAVEVPRHTSPREIGALAKAMAIFKANAGEARAVEQARAAEQAEKLRRQQAVMGLTRDFSNFVEQQLVHLTEAVDSLNDTAQTLGGQAQQTQRQTELVATSASVALRSVETVSAASEQLAASGGRIGEQALDAAERTRAAAEQSNQARSVLAGLNDAAQGISEVVALIRSIAAQTNLLALNATIEAARAGEAGRGFAVVAGEVKVLASQTAGAVDAVQARVEAIRAGSGAASASIDQIAGMVADISRVAGQIAASIAEQGTAAGEIARAVRESAGASQSAAARVTELREGVEITRGASEGLTQAAAAMAARTEELSGEVAGFVAAVGGPDERRQAPQERRRFERRRPDTPVTLHLSDGRQVPGRLMDIGLGGCAVRCDVAGEPGEEIGVVVDGEVRPARIVHATDGVARLQFRVELAPATLKVA